MSNRFQFRAGDAGVSLGAASLVMLAEWWNLNLGSQGAFFVRFGPAYTVTTIFAVAMLTIFLAGLFWTGFAVVRGLQNPLFATAYSWALVVFLAVPVNAVRGYSAFSVTYPFFSFTAWRNTIGIAGCAALALALVGSADPGTRGRVLTWPDGWRGGRPRRWSPSSSR